MNHRLWPAVMILGLLLVFGSPARPLEAMNHDGPGYFPLVCKGRAAKIYFDAGDYRVVAIAASDLAHDIERVSGTRPELVSSLQGVSGPVVIIGTLEKNPVIAGLAASGKIEADRIRGQWESYGLVTVGNPLPGVERALVIAGSDRRGAAYGAFELSRAIGVSPWVWWADSAPGHKDELFIPGGAAWFGPPSVKYRGIFLNDEDFGLRPWAAKTLDPALGDIGPRTYAKVFELLLRLKANLLWPAMHPGTHAFNFYPEDKVLADDYAIVMGSSHCEQMLRNNVDEWRREGKGRWWYQFNRANILAYWEKRVRENGMYENIYTLGMRALHDSPIHALGGTGVKIRLLDKIISDQRGLLARWVNPDLGKVPQVFCPYNEVLGYLDKGLQVPAEVTMLWVDDNHGYIRRLSDPAEQARPGGAGVYYHVSYWGPPHDYLWLCSTPPALIWEEMSKAYALNARRIWMLNVGDLKPAELDIEFFLDLAWDHDQYGPDAQPKFLRAFAAREFEPGRADEVADILGQYFLLDYRRKPEHMGFNLLGEKGVPDRDPRFSLYNSGDEAQERINRFVEIERWAEAVYQDLPPEKRAAFYQLVLYPVRESLYMNQKMLLAFKSREYAKQGRADAGRYAEEAAAAFDNIKRETSYYNEALSGGKWRGMMSDHPRNLTVFAMPKTGRSVPRPGAALGVAIEGMAKPVLARAGLPEFNRFTRRKYFIDVFNRGSSPLKWSARAPDWVRLSSREGSAPPDERIWVDVDFSRAPGGEDVSGKIIISGGGAGREVEVRVFNPEGLEVPAGTFVQDNGVIAINASGFKSKSPGHNGSEWTKVAGLGRTGSAMAIMPFDSPPAAVADAPAMEYPLYVFRGGEARLTLEAVPTHPLYEGRRTAAAISIDHGAPVELIPARESIELMGFMWTDAVLSSVMYGRTDVVLGQGAHVLEVRGIDSSLVLDRLVLDFGGLKPSYLGPEQTRAVP